MKKIQWKEILSGFTTFIVAIAVVVLIRSYFIDVAFVSGQSMENTIFDSERVLLWKIGEPAVNDIVIVKTDSGTNLIKRVIAKEGDEVEIKKGELYVNDKLIEEDYIKEEMNDYDFSKIKVPDNEIFVLGDNRNHSSDSRFYGTFNLDDDFIGKVFFDWKPFFR